MASFSLEDSKNETEGDLAQIALRRRARERGISSSDLTLPVQVGSPVSKLFSGGVLPTDETVIPEEKPSLLRRLGRGATQAVEEAVTHGGEHFQGGWRAVRDNLGQAIDESGDIDPVAVGKTVLGVLNIIGAVPGAIGETAAKMPLRMTEEALSTKAPRSAELLTDVAGGLLGGAVPLLPRVSSENALARLRMSRPTTAATEEAGAVGGALSDAAKAEEFSQNVFNVSAGEALRGGLIEKSATGGYKLTTAGLRATLRASPEELSRPALPAPETPGTPRTTEGPTPGRVIEAPPSEDKLTARIRERLREEQAAATGEYAPEGPFPRVIKTGSLRSVEEGPRSSGSTVGKTVIGSREVPPESGSTTIEDVGNIPEEVGRTPRDFKTGPSGKERTEGYESPAPRHVDENIPPKSDAANRLANESSDSAREAAPTSVREEASIGDPLPDPDAPGVFGRGGTISRFFQGVKPQIGLLSPTQVARGDKPFEELVQLTKDVRREAASKADKWLSARDDIRRALGSDEEFANALRRRDNGLDATSDPKINQMIDSLYNEVATNLGIPPGHPMFKEGYVRRLRQDRVVQDTRLETVTPYVTEDLSRIVPGKTRPGFLKRRSLEEPGGEESYTPDAVGNYLRAAARASTLGTEFKSGYLDTIKPLLSELSDRPDAVRQYVQNYVNYFIGAPGSRSSEEITKWANLVRSYQFLRTIGGNALSPIWNLTQQGLTFAETSLPAFLRAQKDFSKFVKPGMFDKTGELSSLLERAGLSHELEHAGAASDLPDIPSELMTKIERGMATATDWSGIPFRFTERWNRTHAFLAGYYDAIRQGMSDADAITNGKHVMDKTQFTGGMADMPSLYRSASGGLVGQFKQFSTKYAEYVYNNFKDVVQPGATWDERAEAAKKFAKFWGGQMMVGGTSAIPFIGDWVEEKIGHLPGNVQRGVGGLLGVALTSQVGLNNIPITSIKDFTFSLPGPAATGFLEGISAVSNKNFDLNDMGNWGKELTPDQRAAKITHLLPLGTQLNRVRRAFQVAWTDGIVKDPTDLEEAFGLSAPSGSRRAEVTVNPIVRGIGLQTLEQEREQNIRRNLAEQDQIGREALRKAAEVRASGKSGAQILMDAEDEMGLPRGTLKLSPGAVGQATKKLNVSPLERARETHKKRGIVVPSSYED